MGRQIHCYSSSPLSDNPPFTELILLCLLKWLYGFNILESGKTSGSLEIWNSKPFQMEKLLWYIRFSEATQATFSREKKPKQNEQPLLSPAKNPIPPTYPAKKKNQKWGKRKAKGKKIKNCILVFHLNLHFTCSAGVCDLKLQFSKRGH